MTVFIKVFVSATGLNGTGGAAGAPPPHPNEKTATVTNKDFRIIADPLFSI
jgi:hypothetical protein